MPQPTTQQDSIPEPMDTTHKQDLNSSNKDDQNLMCVECEDTEATIYCKSCDDRYCALCFQWQHSKGTRFYHAKELLKEDSASLIGTTAQFTGSSGKQNGVLDSSGSSKSTEPPKPVKGDSSVIGLADQGKLWLHEEEEEKNEEEEEDEEEEDEEVLEKRQNLLAKKAGKELTRESLLEKSKFMPLRLTEEERGLLHLLEGALTVSEYTDKVDIADNNYGFGFGFGFGLGSWRSSNSSQSSKNERIRKEQEEVFNILCGLDVCKDFRSGVKMLATPASRAAFLRRCFEVGRRNKILNPDHMRGTYGKMMFLLQDSVAYSTADAISLTEDNNPATVYRHLKQYKLLDLLTEDEKLVRIATKPITPSPSKTPEHMKKEAAAKEAAIEMLVRKYVKDNEDSQKGNTSGSENGKHSRGPISEDEFRRVLHSIADNQYFLEGYRKPVDRMLHYLTSCFDHRRPEPKLSLEIRYGRNGSMLSHDHETQFTFVLQSLLLWRELMNQLFRLWFLAEEDLLAPNNRYRLMDTGQGLNRVQTAPNIGAAMSSVLRDVHSTVKSWVGLSVVHLGDRDVPNALVFIDKYSQVPRILGPIVHTLDSLESLAKEDAGIMTIIEKHYGTVLQLQKEILCDYFKHGFDGSGSDGGSCIDGRLTSSWNWCSKIEKKPYFPFFLLTGFQGFDGNYRT